MKLNISGREFNPTANLGLTHQASLDSYFSSHKWFIKGLYLYSRYFAMASQMSVLQHVHSPPMSVCRFGHVFLAHVHTFSYPLAENICRAWFMVSGPPSSRGIISTSRFQCSIKRVLYTLTLSLDAILMIRGQLTALLFMFSELSLMIIYSTRTLQSQSANRLLPMFITMMVTVGLACIEKFEFSAGCTVRKTPHAVVYYR